jgi:hypothetical protein
MSFSPDEGVPGVVGVLDPQLDGLHLARALVGEHPAEDDLEPVGELEQRRDLIESHVPEVDAGELKVERNLSVTFIRKPEVDG